MGQAKLRGSFEQRQAEGIARLEREATERQRKVNEAKAQEHRRQAALYQADPVGYEREKRKRIETHSLIAMVAGMLAEPLRKLRR